MQVGVSREKKVKRIHGESSEHDYMPPLMLNQFIKSTGPVSRAAWYFEKSKHVIAIKGGLVCARGQSRLHRNAKYRALSSAEAMKDLGRG